MKCLKGMTGEPIPQTTPTTGSVIPRPKKMTVPMPIRTSWPPVYLDHPIQHDLTNYSHDGKPEELGFVTGPPPHPGPAIEAGRHQGQGVWGRPPHSFVAGMYD